MTRLAASEMSEPGARYVLRGGRAGYDRLKVLARARRDDTLALLGRAGVRAGWRCLDVGCGGGDVTLEIGRMVGDQGAVVGLDMDAEKLELARQAAADSGLTNVEFRVADVTQWNEPGAYHLAYCRFLLQHLTRPLDLIRRMWASVRSGGALVIEDADFDGFFCEPANAGFDFHARLFPRTIARYGGDPTLGRKLYGMFLEAGIPDPHLSMYQRVNATGEEKLMPMLTLESAAPSIIDGGLATAEEVESAIASLAALADDPTAIVGSPRIFQVWSGRP